MFKPNRQFVNTELDYLYAAEKSYIEELERKGFLLKIQNIIIDVPNVISRRFFCDSSYCIRKKGSKYFGSCCTDCEIQISKEDIQRLNLLFEKYNAVYNVAEIFWGKNNVEENYLLHNANNTCALSYFDKKGSLLCLVDRICREQNLSVSEWKPHLCYTWPLMFLEFEIHKYFLSCYNYEICKMINVGTGVGNLRCIRSPRDSWPFLYDSLKDIIIKIFGTEFFNILKKKADELIKISQY